MRSQKKILEDKKDSMQLLHLVETFEEISASKIQKIREGILSSRQYYTRLTLLLEEVGDDLTPVSGGKSEAAVFLSANEGLYGAIVEQTFSLFLSESKDKKKIIVGKMGKSLMDNFSPNASYDYFDFPDDALDRDSFRPIAQKLLTFSKVAVYYGQFESIAVQHASSSVLSSDLISSFAKQAKKKGFAVNFLSFLPNIVSGALTPQEVSMQTTSNARFIYEPTISEISEKFQNEVFSSVFEDKVREGQLAKEGSRIMMLDQSLDKIKQNQDLLTREARKAKRITDGKKQRSRVVRIFTKK